MIKIFDTFAGVGGFHLALENAIGKENVELIGFSEIDNFAKQTYLKNFPGAKDFGDITKIDIKNLPDFDLITGGFPCQDVSVAGKQDLSGGRTVLVEYLLEILEIKKPKYFIFENVKGLMSKKFDTFRNSIFERIQAAGYNFQYKILNTKNFGLPQNRERIYIVGSLENIDYFKYPEEKPLKIFLEDILEKEVAEKYFISNDVFEKLKKYESNARLVEKICSCLNTMQGGHRQPKIVVNKYNNRSFENGICGTLGTGMGFTGKQGYQVVNNDKSIRKLTPLECERLQGFPDNWTAGVSDSQRYKQMGNAISTPVAENVFKNLFNNL